MVERFTEGRLLGIVGEPRVNVLRLNMALDAPQVLKGIMGDANRKPENSVPIPTHCWRLRAAEGRGRLPLFLGAAPGVGKTFTMLTRARRLRAEGVDIVVGLVETHGRCETAALLDGLEVLPRRHVDHQGRQIEEFDLDAALARRPKIIIVDELAHTNAPDSRHPKSYLDVEELLAAGINVWSAMNIQHLESLSDVVAQITGVPVRERVPDIVLSRADDVLLVDLAPAELIERLKQGKVYLPDNAKRAVDSFFRLGNLTALREMALRRTADRVDDQMVDYLKQNAIEGPWQTAERLLVCIGPDRLSEKVVRTAARLASGLNAPWLVISIERADGPRRDPEVHAGWLRRSSSRKAGRRDPPHHRPGFCRGDTQDRAPRACDADRHRQPAPDLSRELFRNRCRMR